MAHYNKVIWALKQFKHEIPTLVGNELVNYGLDNLRSESYLGVPWAPRKPGAVRNQGRRLLIDTGDGERSIRQRRSGRSVEVTANKYMEAHNTGATITGTFSVREHTRRRRSRAHKVSAHQRTVNTTLPERTFLAADEVLFKRIESVLSNRLKTLLK